MQASSTVRQGVLDSLGTSLFHLDTSTMVYNYNADGTLNYEQATTRGGNIYRKTYTYTSGRLTGESNWVKQ